MTRALLVVPLVVAGCASDRQAVAVGIVERAAPGTHVTCTLSAHVGYLREVPTKLFLCIAKRGANDCDHYTVTRGERSWHVRRTERDGECVLPAS